MTGEEQLLDYTLEKPSRQMPMIVIKQRIQNTYLQH